MPLVVLLVPFFAIVGAFVLVGLSQTHSAQHGTQSIQGFISTAISNSFVGQIFNLGVKATRSLISRYAASHLKMLTAYLNGMASLWKQEFAAMRAEAKATQGVAAAIEQAIPREAKKAAAPALARAKVADRHANTALGLGRSNVRALNRYKASTNARLKADAHAIDVTIPNDIAGLRRRTKEVEDAQAKDRGAIGELEDGAAKTWDWINSHPLAGVTAAFGLAVGVALNRLGLGWLRCRSNPFTQSKNPCGLWTILGRVLGLAAFLGLAFDFQEFVAAAEVVASGIGDAVSGIEGTFNLSLPPLPPPLD